MKKTTFFLLSSLLLLFSACGQTRPSSPTRNAPDDSTSLRVAVLPTLGCLPLLYAVESGLADSLGLPLRYELCHTQWDADTALLGGSVDAAYLDAARWDYYQNRGKMKKMSLLLPTPERYHLLLGGNLRVRKLEKIKQRTIAAPRYTQQERYLHHLRDSLGLKQDELFQPQINNYEVALRMLVNEQLDGLVLPEPWGTQALSQGQRVLGTAQKFQDAGIYVRAFSAKAQRKQQQAKLLKQVYNVAVKQLNTQRTALLDSLLTQRYHLTSEALHKLELPRYAPLP